MPPDPNPPFYVLLAHSSLSTLPTAPLSSTLAHPTIQYHYADDSPLSLLPTHPTQDVLLLHHSQTSPPSAQSLSHRLVVTALKVEEAPGAAGDAAAPRNNSMFVIETTTNDAPSPDPHTKTPQAILAQFKQRNQVIRRALEYPIPPTTDVALSG